MAGKSRDWYEDAVEDAISGVPISTISERVGLSKGRLYELLARRYPGFDSMLGYRIVASPKSNQSPKRPTERMMFAGVVAISNKRLTRIIEATPRTTMTSHAKARVFVQSCRAMVGTDRGE